MFFLKVQARQLIHWAIKKKKSRDASFHFFSLCFICKLSFAFKREALTARRWCGSVVGFRTLSDQNLVFPACVPGRRVANNRHKKGRRRELKEQEVSRQPAVNPGLNKSSLPPFAVTLLLRPDPGQLRAHSAARNQPPPPH